MKIKISIFKLFLVLCLFICGCSGINTNLSKPEFSIEEFEHLLNSGQIDKIPESMIDALKETRKIEKNVKQTLLARFYSTSASYYYHKNEKDNYLINLGELTVINPSERNVSDFINAVYTNYYKNSDYSKTISIINSIEPRLPKIYREIVELKIYAYYFSQNIYDVLSLIPRYSKQIKYSNNFLKFIEKVKNEYSTELSFYEYNSGNYDIFYDNSVSYDTVMALASYLDQAINYCSDFFGWYPDVKVAVLIYSAADYRKNINAPNWSSALFDGKIRIPVSMNSHPQYLRTLVFHEYTHSIQFQKTNGNMISYWFAEGIAKLIEVAANNLNYKESGEYIELNEIDDIFRTKKSDYQKIKMAYYESYLIIKSISEKFGNRAISAIADNYRKFRDLNVSFEREIFMNQAEFFERIKNDIKKEIENSK